MAKRYTSAVRTKSIYYVANPYLVQNKRNNTYVIMCNNNVASSENNRNASYEDIVNTGLSNPIVDLGIDYSEMGLDSFMPMFFSASGYISYTTIEYGLSLCKTAK